jgi:signal transduction histidine kinase
MAPTSPMQSPRLSLAPVVVAFAVVALGFVLATAYGEIRASAIDEETEQLETNALPSVEHLAAARDALWHLENGSNAYVDEPGAGRQEAELAMATARRDVDAELATEFATDAYPGESQLQSDATRALGDLDRLLSRMREVTSHDEAEGHAYERQQVRSGIERVDVAIDRIMALNATEGHAEARRIASIRAGSLRLLFVLNVACVVFSSVAAFVALRSLRRQRSLELAHEALLEVQAADLERFASRVAHDLLSPLSALAFTLTTLRRNAEKGLPLEEPIGRAEACLKRSQSLVDGVMDFARSGGAAPGGRASLRRILDGVLEEARSEAPGIDVIVEGLDDDVQAGCSAGVLTSILSNLVRNAVKYMDGRPEQRLSIRATTSGGTVRVEVADTGPGLPPGLEPHVFEPYVRSPDNPKPGLGLGLATVQRFVESHEGRVGVESSPGHGCVFWFELPRAGVDGRRLAAPGVEGEPHARRLGGRRR